MRFRAAALLATLLLVSPALSLQESTAPPSGDDAAARLASSARHGEWVAIPAGSGGNVDAWIVYPERATAAPVIVVIHEIFGMTDWIRSVADSLAAAGFIAIAPDLLSGKGPDGGGTASLENPRAAIRDLDPAEIKQRLDATAEWAMARPAATSSFGVVGFCWGGSTSFRYAAQQPAASASIVYYGGSPDAEILADLRVPVLGLYGGNDNRVNATIEPAREALSGTSATYEVEIYDGAGHGFLRALKHETLGEANRAAAAAAWTRSIAWFRQHLES